MATGYSSSPLFKKLGIKEGFSVAIINPPLNYKELIAEVSDKIIFKKEIATGLDLIHFFTNSAKELENKLPRFKRQILKNGSIWVSWYKKTSDKPTELNENIVRDTALAIGLVDVKVCAVDEDWSGLKLVFRLKDRN